MEDCVIPELLDISYWQGPSGTKPPVDFDAVKTSGVKAVQIRTNLGLWEDRNATGNIRNAVAAGLKWGPYIALRPSDPPLAQVGLLQDVVLKSGFGPQLAPWADIEITPYSMTKSDFAARCHYAVLALKRAYGRTLIYTRIEWWRRLLFPQTPWAQEYGLVVARYGKPLPWGNPGDVAAVYPLDWTDYVSHQYTDREIVLGITGGVDAHRVKDWNLLLL